MSFDFAQLTDYQLLKGSHEFPGSAGGTCINEAAVVAAGLPYRAVRSIEDLPPCFSPVFGQFLLSLNDLLPLRERQDLKRYVLQLAGTRDDETIERDRATVLVSGIATQILPLILRAFAPHVVFTPPMNVPVQRSAEAASKFAERYATRRNRSVLIPLRAFAQVLQDERDLQYRIERFKETVRGSFVFQYLEFEVRPKAEVAAGVSAIRVGLDVVSMFLRDQPAYVRTGANRQSFDHTVRRMVQTLLSLFDEALAIGRQAEPVYPELARQRLAAALQIYAEA